MATDEALAATTDRLRGLFATCDERSHEIVRRLRSLQSARLRMEEERERVIRTTQGLSAGLAVQRDEARRRRDSWTGPGLETTAAAASARIATHVRAAEEAARERRRVAETADVDTRKRTPKSLLVGGVGGRNETRRPVIPVYDLFGEYDFAGTAEKADRAAGDRAGAEAGATTERVKAATSTTAAGSGPFDDRSIEWWRQQHALVVQNAEKLAAELSSCKGKLRTREEQLDDEEGVALSYTPEFDGVLKRSWETFPPTKDGFNDIIDGDQRRCFRSGRGHASNDAMHAGQWGVTYERRGSQCDRKPKKGDTVRGWVYCMRMCAAAPHPPHTQRPARTPRRAQPRALHAVRAHTHALTHPHTTRPPRPLAGTRRTPTPRRTSSKSADAAGAS